MGGIAKSVTDTDLRELFAKYGEVAGVFVNAEKGFAFVNFATPPAERAALELHGMTYKGKILNVKAAGRCCCRFYTCVYLQLRAMAVYRDIYTG